MTTKSIRFFIATTLLVPLLSLITLTPAYADDTYSGKDCSKYVDAYGDPIKATYDLCMENGGYDGSQSVDNVPASYGSCDTFFLGLVPWHCNVKENPSSETELTDNIITIAGNIFTDITIIASYLVVGYVIYGGYLYMFSSGDPSKAMAGKKTLLHAFIGLAIVVFSSVILNTIRLVFIGSGNLADCATTGCTDASTLVTNLIQWVIGVAGLVSAVFIVIGGVGYITSAGEPNKLQKSKQTIIYALIGLVIVGLAEAITLFVSNLIENAG